MKKLLLFFVLLNFSLGLGAQNVKKIVVKSAIKGCWAAIIAEEDAKKPENEFGWWSAWQKIKAEKKYKTTPATFTNIPKGKYIVVVYNPASQSFDPNAGIPEQTSDGVVLEAVDIQKNQSFDFKKADFKEWNCLSCPWLYVWNGQDFVREQEIIKDVVGKKNEQTTYTNLKPTCVIQQTIKIRIQEEKDEISYLNQIVLQINDKIYYPQANFTENQLQQADNSYFQLKKGEMIDLEFVINESIKPNDKIQLIARGYYEPDRKFLTEIYRKYLKTR
jgi:hypothetical protein